MAAKHVVPPMPIKVKPYDHQQKVFYFACKQFGLLDSTQISRGIALLMEMGTGKSLTSIGIAGILYQLGLVKRVLVVAPLSILGVWVEEFQKYADFSFTLTVLKGSSTKKREALQNIGADGLQIAVVNYEPAWRLEDELLRFDAGLIIADEAHKLKEARTSQSKAMHHLSDKARYKLLLTGTIITNKELDVFSQYRFLNHGIFGSSFYTFRNRYFDMVGYGNHIPRFRKYMTEDFLQRMHSIAYRVTTAECLDLPKITEKIRSMELEPKARKIYKELEKESYTELARLEVSAVNALTKLLRLSQVTGGHLIDDEGDTNAISTAKLDALSDILDSVMAEDKKIVVMARFIPELNDIQALLEKYNAYIEYLNRYEDGLFGSVIYDISTEIEYILFQNRDFLLRFNEEQAVMFQDSSRKRKYIPEWVKRAVLFRDKGCCVFCKKDLTVLYSLLEDNEKHFDHIVLLNEGGINDVCNIQLSCKYCNLKKSDSSRTSTLYQSAY